MAIGSGVVLVLGRSRAPANPAPATIAAAMSVVFSGSPRPREVATTSAVASTADTARVPIPRPMAAVTPVAIA